MGLPVAAEPGSSAVNVLALAYTTTRKLWMPIALHFSWSFLQGPVLGIAVSGQAMDSGWRALADGPAVFTGGPFGLEGGLAATLATLLGMVALVAPGRWAGGGRTAPRSSLARSDGLSRK